MVILRDFLQVAVDAVVIEEKGKHVTEINPEYLKTDILSQKLLNSKIRMVGTIMSDGKLHVVLEGDIKDE